MGDWCADGGSRQSAWGVKMSGRRVVTVLAGVTLFVGLVAVFGVGSGAPLVGRREALDIPAARAAKGGRRSSPSQLIDHGGKILPSSTIHAIFWGPPGDFPADAHTGLSTLLSGFNGSSYLGIAQQYMRGASISTAFGGSVDDASDPPTRGPSVSTIANEVSREFPSPDPNSVYIVFTSNFPKVNYCAWHSAARIGAVTVQVAYVPNATNVAGCDPGDLYNANSYSQGTRSMADSTAHEFMESITDPVPLSGWADKRGGEIGDKCNFNYQAPVQLGNGSKWQLQTEWSNAIVGCQQ